MGVPNWLRGLLIGTGWFLGFVVVAIVYFYWSAHVAPFRTMSFDPAVWHACVTNETDSTCYRGGMAHDIQQLLNVKMSREDIVRLLGKPDGHYTDHEYQYVLGMCSGLHIDYDNLHVHFDSKGFFTNASIIQH